MPGYKIFSRYSQDGLEALTDRSRRPVRYANQLPEQIERLIVETKKGKPHWGARKIRELLVRRLAGDVRIPAKSTVHAVLDRHGLVSGARKRRAANKAMGTILSQAHLPNDLWCADFKGEFKTGNGRYCYPLTVTDQVSRMILMCEALESTRELPVIEAFVHLFAERGLPGAIRTDNGLPFASPNGLYNLSKLSVFWLRLGIAIERIQPGHPQQNGRHERMHRTLKQETAKPAAFNFLQQQECFDDFLRVYNNERPHQGLGGACPGQFHTPSARIYRQPDEPDYPFHDRIVRVTRCGRICIGKCKINLSTVFAGQLLGLRKVDEGIWLVSFLDYDLGFFDKEEDRVEPGPNPFTPEKLSTISPE